MPLSAGAQVECIDAPLVPADVSGFPQLPLVPVDDGDGLGAWNLWYCPTTECFYALGDEEVILTNVGFKFGRDERGAMVMESCEVENSPSSFRAEFFRSDPEELPEGMENPGVDTDNCIRETDRHVDDDGERGGTADACLALDGAGPPVLIVRKNRGGMDFAMAIDSPVVPGDPGECDEIQVPRVFIDTILGRLLMNVSIPTNADCTISLAEEGEGPVIEIGPDGLAQPDRGDIDGDGDVDIDDVRAVLALRNQPANPPSDRTDLNGDGVITVRDARVVVTLCDLPRCARPPQS